MNNHTKDYQLWIYVVLPISLIFISLIMMIFEQENSDSIAFFITQLVFMYVGAILFAIGVLKGVSILSFKKWMVFTILILVTAFVLARLALDINSLVNIISLINEKADLNNQIIGLSSDSSLYLEKMNQIGDIITRQMSYIETYRFFRMVFLLSLTVFLLGLRVFYGFKQEKE